MPCDSHPSDEFFMRRAIRLAMNGRGLVEPNPMVGCVVVRDGKIVGEGFHERFGGPHAEPNALEAVRRSGHSTDGATAYVTLEPCCHTNKKTPPCVPALVAGKVSRVVVGCLDPNPEVSGRGVEQLRAAGIAVDVDVCRDECRQVIAPFYATTVLKRPYVTLKWAESADGKVAGPKGARRKISNEHATRAVHELRARCDAIMVGINTVLNDDPMLTARDVPNARPLVRYVLDRNLRIPLTSRLVATARDVPLVVACHIDETTRQAEKVRQLAELGVRTQLTTAMARVMIGLGTWRVTHLLVEPGPTLAQAFFSEFPNFVDRVWVIRSPKAMDEPDTLDAPRVPTEYVVTGRANLSGDRLTEYLNPNGGAYFHPQPSADFIHLSHFDPPVSVAWKSIE